MTRTLRTSAAWAFGLMLALTHVVFAAEPVPAAKPAPPPSGDSAHSAPARATTPAPRPGTQPSAAVADEAAARELQARKEAQRWHEAVHAYTDEASTLKSFVLLAAILGILFVVLVLSLQLSCWFALVEANFSRCARLTVLLAIPTGCAWLLSVVISMQAYSSMKGNWLLLLVPLWLVAQACCGYLTRRVLECRWRSVVTIYTMFNLTGSVMTTVAAVMGITIWLGFSAFSG